METILSVSHVAHMHSEEATEAKWPLCSAAGSQHVRNCCAPQHPPSYETLSEKVQTIAWESNETHGSYDALRKRRKMAPPCLNSCSASHGAPHQSRCALITDFQTCFTLFSVTVSFLLLHTQRWGPCGIHGVALSTLRDPNAVFKGQKVQVKESCIRTLRLHMFDFVPLLCLPGTFAGGCLGSNCFGVSYADPDLGGCDGSRIIKARPGHSR